MSSSILKRSLDLFNDEDDDLNAAKKSKGNTKKAKDKQKTNTNRRQKSKNKHKQKATDLDHDRTEESLKFLQRLSKANKTDGQTTKAILSYNKGRLSKNEEKLEPVDRSTVFNDTDFDKFEEEFDFFSWQ